MASPIDVHRDLVYFLQLPHLPFVPIEGRVSGYAGGRPFLVPGGTTSLFQAILKRAPEKRAQDAMYPFLLDRYPSVLREHALYVDGKRRIFDFYIPPGAADDLPVIIELKHYSVHQSGKFNALLGGPLSRFSLFADLIKPRPKCHFIQVGLFTAVESYHSCLRTGPDSNPFIRAYVQSPAPAGYASQAAADLAAWQARSFYACPTRPATGSDLHTPASASVFKAGQSYAAGRVSSFVGLVSSQPAVLRGYQEHSAPFEQSSLLHMHRRAG